MLIFLMVLKNVWAMKPSWVVPHSIYPQGYHVSPHLPLPFMSIASQKTLLDYIIWEYTPTQNLQMVDRRIC